MVCTALDVEKNFCNHLQQKFYTGMQKPCDDVPDPSKCPLVILKEG